jgi:stress-induced-phosphoprotein 1
MDQVRPQFDDTQWNLSTGKTRNTFFNHSFFCATFQINSLKEKGNAALQADKFDEAIQAYSEAIELDAKNHVLYSNRSAAFLKAGKLEEALKDAEQTIELNPTWAKGYSRKGAVLTYMQKYPEAFDTYKKGENH